MFFRGRRDSMQLEHPTDGGDTTHSSEIFTITSHVPPTSTRQPDVSRSLPRHNTDSNVPRQTPQVLGETDSTGRRKLEDSDNETSQLVFGRERVQVLDLLRQRTAQLYIFLKQKFHTRTLNIDSNSSDRDSKTDTVPQFQTISSTQEVSTKNATASNFDAGFHSSKLNVLRRQKTSSELADSDELKPVQNLVQDSQLSVEPGRTMLDEMQPITRRANSVPPLHNTTTAVIHREQSSPWLNIRENSSSDALTARNALQRAKSVNVNSGKPAKTACQVSDDSNVKYRPDWTHVTFYKG